MNRNTVHIILLLGSLLVALPGRVTGQANDAVILSSPLYRERFYLFTDRSLYAAGENILFRTFNLSDPLLKKNNWSRVLYVELVSPGNKPVARGKYMLGPAGASGGIAIPDTLTSGSYCLRAYTKWMRNYPPSDYFHVPMAIVNPGKPVMAGRSPATPGPRRGGAGTAGAGPVTRNGISCSAGKAAYGKREKVRVDINGATDLHASDGYCISVVRKGYLDTAFLFVPARQATGEQARTALEYYPETKGLSITGQVTGGTRRQPLAFRNVYLTLLGSDPDCFGLITDEQGRFNFAIRYHAGASDVLVTVDREEGEPVNVILQDEFSWEYTGIPEPGVDFFSERRDQVRELMAYAQLAQLFMPPRGDTITAADRKSGQAFYGLPDFRYRTDDYILLPNLQEFFYELVPSIQLKRDRGARHLMLLDEKFIMMHSPPLILLDYVPVLDVGNILNVSPGLIEYIDVINTQYIRGRNYYSGLVSLVSKNGDHAGVPLPPGASFFSYSTYAESDRAHFPDYGSLGYRPELPDLRTTLYWDPNIDLSADGEKSIEFYTSDIAGEYMVLIQGITPEGGIIRSVCSFRVE